LEPGDDTKDSNKGKRSPCQSPGYGGPSSSHYSKKNVGKNANASGDGSANNTASDDVKMEEEAPVATSSI